MSLFGKQNSEVAERQKRDQERLARGGLPLDAERRLTALRQNSKLFTSNLSVSEFVLCASEGVRPLGQVMGSTVYHVGWQYTPIYASSELVALSHAQYHARLLALSRLQQEAGLLGAHGVVGVRLERRGGDWGENLLEFTARGTAVSLDDAPVPEKPFVCALSGQEFWALRRAGFLPTGFAFGTCVFYHVASYTTQWATQGGLWGNPMNMELTDYTQAIYHIRREAMTRLHQDAARVPAEGIIGVTVETDVQTREVENNNQTRRDLIVHFTALGTVIVSASVASAPAIDYALTLTG